MATTCNISTPARPSRPLSAFVVSVIVTGLRKLSRALKNRRQARMLAGMDDRMLADIGLNRSDLRDAYAEPLWRDPTDMLAGRACEKRRYRRAGLSAPRISAPSVAPDAGFETATTGRPARHPI